MKWNKTDVQKFIQEKEYIDTLIIPLLPFHLSNDSQLEENALQSETLSIFANEIERELTGRTMLAPNYIYLKSANHQAEVKRLNKWLEDASEQPFEHQFLLTFDPAWKKNEKDLNGTLLWLPGLSFGDLNKSEVKQLIRGQVSQLVGLIQSYWS